ncbi:lipopolysaccharide export system permease protein [Filimonas lacunae]|uniref:Lipopolysaccharide export system permease protein n=1 Tax=Filimonas lacunae TaxID=477680 RepID=A0A173M9U2_9BACT|nr:LptF/LptG family permease [Filimonas lacunae]BAV04306.1 membrane protein [Filimonas lacunae]SIT30971.1 lipopolysaccharide export system permease protein [Filimonas lacunae]
MKKLDWYIIKKFLTTFFFAIFLFAIISVVVDVGEKTDDFVKSGWSFSKIVVDYYLAFIPHIIALLFPLFVFIAVIFFTSKMAGKSEIVAILASGVHFRRVLQPYLLAGIFLGAILWYANGYVIPRAEVKRTYFEDVYVNGNSTYNPLVQGSNNLYFRIDSFTYAGVHYYDTVRKQGGPFFLHRVSKAKPHEVSFNLRAETIRWDTATKKWALDQVVEREIDGLKEKTTLTATKQMKFTFEPRDLRKDDFAKDKMTTPELVHRIKLEELRGTEGVKALQIERYRRDATPIAVIILTLIGAIIGSKKVRGGSGVHLAMGFIIAALFILMDRFSTIFSTKGNLPPLVAAWIPNLVFSCVAYYIYKKSPK